MVENYVVSAKPAAEFTTSKELTAAGIYGQQLHFSARARDRDRGERSLSALETACGQTSQLSDRRFI